MSFVANLCLLFSFSLLSSHNFKSFSYNSFITTDRDITTFTATRKLMPLARLLRILNLPSRFLYYSLRFGYLSLVFCHLSLVFCHLSLVFCHTSISFHKLFLFC